jgi:hypothetical protein
MRMPGMPDSAAAARANSLVPETASIRLRDQSKFNATATFGDCDVSMSFNDQSGLLRSNGSTLCLSSGAKFKAAGASNVSAPARHVRHASCAQAALMPRMQGNRPIKSRCRQPGRHVIINVSTNRIEP